MHFLAADAPAPYRHGLSLLQGWLPLTVQIVAVVVLLAALGWRTRRWWLIWLPVAVLVGVGAAAWAHWYVDSQGMAATLTGYLMSAQEDSANIYKVGLGSVRFLMSVGDLVLGWLLQKQAVVAIDALDQGVTGADKSCLLYTSPSPRDRS